MTSTQKFIQEVEKRLEAATPGPWFYDVGNCEVEGPGRCHIAHVGNLDDRFRRDDGSDCWVNDGDMIAHSRTDLAKAIAALKEAHLTLTEQLKHVCDGGGDKPCSQMWFQDVAQESLNEIEKILGEK